MPPEGPEDESEIASLATRKLDKINVDMDQIPLHTPDQMDTKILKDKEEDPSKISTKVQPHPAESCAGPLPESPEFINRLNISVTSKGMTAGDLAEIFRDIDQLYNLILVVIEPSLYGGRLSDR
jgi:hypothetical protein